MVLKNENELSDKGKKSLIYFKNVYNDIKSKVNI